MVESLAGATHRPSTRKIRCPHVLHIFFAGNPQGLRLKESGVEGQEVFTILLLDASYCVDRASAQRVVDAASRHAKTVEIDAHIPGVSAVTRIPISISKLVRIIEHQSLENERFQFRLDQPHEAVRIARYRSRISL
jgi:hypothetical protein